MRYTLHAEWTKARTLRSTGWLLLAAAALTVLVGAVATGSVNTGHCPSPRACFEDTPKLALTGVRLGQVAVIVFAVLTISAEYGTGTVLPTFVALPRRTAVLAAKALVVGGLVAAAGSVAVGICLAVGRVTLPHAGLTAAEGYPPLSLLDGPTLRASAGTVLYLVLVALLALGVATALRDTAAALTTTLTLLFVLPIVSTFVSDPHWHERLERWSPMTSGLAVQTTVRTGHQVIGPWPGLAVLGAYAGSALALAALTLTLRAATPPR